MKTSVNKRQLGMILCIVSALFFGFTPILASQTYTWGCNAITLSFFRNVFAMIMIGIVLIIKKEKMSITKKQGGQIAWIGVMGSAITTVTLYASYDYISVGTATTLHFLYPMVAALLCWVFYKEHITKQKWIALVISLIGIMFFLDDVSLDKIMGIGLSVFSGITYAYYMVEVDKKKLKEMPALKLSFYFSVVVSLALGIFGIATNSLLFTLPIKAYAMIALISLFTSFLGVYLLLVGIRYLGASTAAILCLFEPVSSIVFGMMFLNESLTAFSALGSIIIIVGLIVMMKEKPSAE